MPPTHDPAPTSSLLYAVSVVVRILALLVTGVLATIGSWALGFGVMTSCTSTTSACGTTSALLTGGWVLQGLLLIGAGALCLPVATRRLSRGRLLGAAVAVALVSVLAFAGTVWVAPRSYCTGDDAARDYCGVEP